MLDSLVTSARPGTEECLPLPGQVPGRPPRPAAVSRTRVVLLGTGNPMPDPEYWGPAVAIVVDGTAYLVDAGVGVVRRASAAARDGVQPLETTRLAKVFVTHLHSDHTLGLPDLMLSPWVIGRSEPLQAWGPAGLHTMARRLMAAWEEDLTVRLGAEQQGDTAGLRTSVCEIGTGTESAVIYTDELVTVTAFAVQHGDWNTRDANRAFGFRFDTPDASVVVSGDTGPAAAVFARHCNGCDILVHEVFAVKHRALLDPERKEYDRTFHTSSIALGETVAPAARPGLLVLYHEGLVPGVTDADLLAEVTRFYKGPVCLGRDLDVFAEGAASSCASTPEARRVPRAGRRR